MKNIAASLFLFIVVLNGCISKNKIPSTVLSPDRMKYIVWDLMKAGELAVQDTLYNKAIDYKKLSMNLYQKVFAIYHIDKISFYKSYDYYLQHPDINKVLMDSITSLGSRERVSLYSHRNIAK